MNAYLLACGVITALMWVARSMDRHLSKQKRARQGLEIQHEKEASWARTLDRLQLESAERWHRRDNSHGLPPRASLVRYGL